MKTTVYKYLMPVTDKTEVVMPDYLKILDVRNHDTERLVLWALVDTTTVMSPKRFYIRGTGHPLTGEEGRFVKTVHDDKYKLVWHVFEDKREHMDSIAKEYR